MRIAIAALVTACVLAQLTRAVLAVLSPDVQRDVGATPATSPGVGPMAGWPTSAAISARPA